MRSEDHVDCALQPLGLSERVQLSIILWKICGGVHPQGNCLRTHY